ncbi:MAG: DNA replication and repair protein RecF [Flavobacteriaceae bacterium]|nr:DNA replication and repair protein RecF [Flavobacteriaceae bacterium]MCY4215574.1 DNA replication and repair protein RecF [Flavobacteriaceae bacterium]MCY4253354.1 DNA replication and repair protein RecF [Flavobacteriaceae bacterium]
MFLNQLKIRGFKNFENEVFDFKKKVNCFTGPNGVGKTNILDTIYHLSFGKSFSAQSKDCLGFNQDVFFIEGSFTHDHKYEKVICSYQKSKNKKILFRNDKPYQKLAEHIGLIPTVLVSPIDRDIIIGKSSDRRKFIDGIIAQINFEFLDSLINYNKALKQRNAYLKNCKIGHSFDEALINSFNQQLIKYGKTLYEKRKAFIEKYAPLFNRHYHHICSGEESVEIIYQSHLDEHDFDMLLTHSTTQDLALGYTSKGLHRDELNFYLNTHPLKKYGSQGQQKSFVTALKFAQHEFLKTETKKSPLLLLDDAFDRLDQKRVSQIINLIDLNEFSQIFLTDTHLSRTKETLRTISTDFEIFQLN